MHEQEVKVEVDGAVLAGTLTAPEKTGKYPAVLMVHGSGPLDRDENMQGQKLNIFNAIARELAEQGIASFRYDKRGCGESTGDFLTTGHAALVLDATECLDALAKSELVDQDRLYLLGHSEGCIIAPQIARERPRVAGLILLCPFIEKLESVLLRQAAQLEKEVGMLRGAAGVFYRMLLKIRGGPMASQKRLIRKVMETNAPVVRVGTDQQPARWLREMLALNPEPIFAATTTPMMLIAGEKDLQCNPEDANRIATVAGNSRTETWIVPGLTHLLRVDENPPIIMGSARLTSLPVEQSVIDKTIQWIHATPAIRDQGNPRASTGSRP